MCAVRAFQSVKAVILKALSPIAGRLGHKHREQRAGRFQSGQVGRHL